MGKKILTGADILAGCKVAEAEFELGSGVIKVRGMTKDVQLRARKNATVNGEFDSDALEIAIFKAGIVEPTLTDEELVQIKATMPAATFDAVVLEVMRLSGVDVKDFAKQAKKS